MVPVSSSQSFLIMMTRLIALLGATTLMATGQDVFPRKPSEAKKDPVPPLVDPTGSDKQAQKPAAEVAAAPVPQPEAEPQPRFTDPDAKPKPKPRFTEPKPTAEEKAHVSEHVIASGDSLTKVSAKAYGRSGYWRLLKLYNDCDPSKLKIGQVVKAPDLDWLLAKENIIPLFQEASDKMMQSRQLFMEAESGIDESGLTEDVKGKLAEAQKLLAQSQELFAAKPEGTTGLPNSTIKQLRTVGLLMGDIANGKGSASSKANLAHEHFGNALTYCVIWARDGFN